MARLVRHLFLAEIISGLATTGRYLFRRRFTTNYPEEKRPLPHGYRGRHLLGRSPDGRERCVGCGLCARVCPAGAIAIETAEGPGRQRVVESYVLDLSRCIFCGFCVEACPVEALVMTDECPPVVRDRKDLVIGKAGLLSPPEEKT